MNPWTDNLLALKGRKNPLSGHDSSMNLGGSDYSGPADGDFARYVEQLLSNAESQRHAQARAPAPVHDARTPARAAAAGGQASARRNPAPAGKASAADSLARLRSQAQGSAGSPALKIGFKLLPLLIWLPLVIALFFWQGAAISLVGMVLMVGLIFNVVRKALGGKKG